MEPDDINALVLGPAARTLAVVPNAPRISAAAAAPLRSITAVDEHGAIRALNLPVERPLTVAIDGRDVVTLMTLGAAPEWLVLGYLRNQRLIDDAAEVRSIEVDWRRGVASVISHSGGLGERSSMRRDAAVATLGCGLGTVFGEAMRQLDGAADGGEGANTEASSAATSRAGGHPISQAALFSILDTMRRHDAIHRAAGSVHSCALFRGAELMVAVEDVSRHNGVDTITGFMRLHGVEGVDKILFTTGRLTGEVVMKAAHNGIPLMISRNGTTAAGYGLAATRGMTLIGRAANRRYVCYIGADRLSGVSGAPPQLI